MVQNGGTIRGTTMLKTVAASCLCLLLLAGAASAQPAMLVLDASGSMWARLDDRPRIAVAQDALAEALGRWPAGRPLGLVAYGHRRGQDCADVELLVPPAAAPAAVIAAASGLVPRGRTPMAEALRQAAAALGSAGGSVILVSDGIETCHPDPCAVAQELARGNPRLVVHGIAFALGDPTGLAQLRCMAEATGGRAFTARDAAELTEALARAAAASAPGPRAAAPRAEPVPPPRLTVTLRLCEGCDPINGEARILLRRGDTLIATDGDPFGRFFDLPAGAYTVQAETPLFRRPPVPVTLEASGIGRAEIILDAGWLVADVRTEPSGHDVTDSVRLEWRPLAPLPEEQRGTAARPSGPAFLVPAGRHGLLARTGNAEATAEAEVAAGETVVLRLPIRFGTLALRREGFGPVMPRVTITAENADTPAFDDRPEEEVAMIRLAPGTYAIVAEHEGREGNTVAEIESEATVETTVSAAE